ncbi:efflux RND transporter periplasmic adaptor subunit [Breoghania sp.]|uniref:efflux RND transporter periplasmic adaptor subunit n=1 Tax=Breoghania sp. TaxID=2065378 RepID=UPI002613E7DA|nr:efflux RND transporter periplasmic adaptor subunit [Breoghania sp.]MDJ0932830.1 efflux RND transporter periplasmic adaptor subunit [Breoghania sp.]
MTTIRKSRIRGRLLIVACLLLVAAGEAYLFRDSLFTDEQPRIITAAVSRGDVEESVLATGLLKPVKLVAVGAQVSGRITSLKVTLGQRIKKGSLVAKIDSITQQYALRTAQATLANVKAQKVEKEASLALAKQTLDRQRRMVVQNAVSQADFDSAEADVKTAEAQIDALDAEIVEAEVAVEDAQADLDYTKITAPIDGTVLWISSQEGQTVNASQSTPTIVILGQLDTMTVRAEISEADIVNVTPGQPVYFTILGDPDTRYDATLESIEPARESITSDSQITSSSSSSSSSEAIYYNGIFNVPNKDGKLRTYMTAEVHIVLGQAKDVLTIPASALGARKADGSYTVSVLGVDGNISARTVEIGLNDKITAEVKSGLKEGERVVSGQLSASDTSSSSQHRGPPPMGL